MHERIQLWGYLLALAAIIAVLAFPELADEFTDLKGDRIGGRGNPSGILRDREPDFLAVEGYLRDDALRRNPDSTDFSEWYYPAAGKAENSIAGLTRHDGTRLNAKPISDPLQLIWEKYDRFTSIYIKPDRAVFSFDSGLSNLIYVLDGERPAYLLSPDEPIEFSATRISDFWYRMRAEDVRK